MLARFAKCHSAQCSQTSSPALGCQPVGWGYTSCCRQQRLQTWRAGLTPASRAAEGAGVQSCQAAAESDAAVTGPDTQRAESDSNQVPASRLSQATSWLNGISGSLRSSPHDSAILALAVPAMLALAADPLLSIVDTIFVGQAGADPLAALGVNSALFTMSFVVFNFLATATTPLVAASLAHGDKDKAGKVTVQALLLAGVLGMGLWGGLAVGAESALSLMGAGPETGAMHDMAKDFLIIRAAASPAVLLATVGQGVFRGLQDMRTPLGITLGANAINLGLDMLLILGLGWGVSGAATATCAAEWAAAVAYLALLWQRREALGGLRLDSVLGERAAKALQDFMPFLKAGGAVLMRTAVLLGTKTLASATAARLGPVPIASHQVVSQLWLLSSLLIDSVAIAGQALVAVELGRGDVKAARDVSNRLLQLGVGLGVVLAAGFWAGEPFIPGIFSSDAAVEAAVQGVLPLAVAMLPVNAAVYVLDGVLVGASDFKFMAGAMVVAAATAVGLLLGVEPLGLGLEGVWGAMAVLMVSRMATLAWRYQDPSGPLPPQQARQQQQDEVSSLIDVEPLDGSSSPSIGLGEPLLPGNAPAAAEGTEQAVLKGPGRLGACSELPYVEIEEFGSPVRVGRGRRTLLANKAVVHPGGAKGAFLHQEQRQHAVAKSYKDE